MSRTEATADSKSEPVIFDSYGQLCVQTANLILDIASKGGVKKGFLSIALSGGKSPLGIYEAMAQAPRAQKLSNKDIHFFQTDERFVPQDHERSNYRSLADALYKKVPIPSAQIHSIVTTGCSPEESARRYEEEIKSRLPLDRRDIPIFDIILLGVGEDGHVASLFPGENLTKQNKPCVFPVEVNNVPEKRVTISMELILNAEHVILFVAGAGKSRVLGQIIENKNGEVFPALTAWRRKKKTFLCADRKTFSAVVVD